MHKFTGFGVPNRMNDGLTPRIPQVLRGGLAALLGTTALFSSAPAAADVVTWDGSESTDWSDPNNWDGGALPTNADIVALDTEGATAPLVGAGVTANSENIYVGSYANGALTILDGGEVVSSGAIYIGNGFAPLTGRVLVTGTGSTLTTSGAAFIGRYGDGELRIEDGAIVTNTATILGLADGSTGLAIVDGPGSVWNSSQAVVGSQTSGHVLVVNGGAWLSGPTSLGSLADATGLVDIVGPGSTWTISGDLRIGLDGVGALSVADGGGVHLFGHAYIADGVGSAGDVDIAGAASSWVIGGVLVLGHAGTATLNITDGASVSANMAVLGDQAGSSGSLLLSGANAQLSVNSDFVVGNGGAGVITLVDGSLLDASGLTLAQHSGSTATLRIGENAGAPGALSATLIQFGDGDGEVVFDHNSSGYNFASAFYGTGAIHHYAGTTFLVGDSSGFDGVTSVHGGALIVNAQLGGIVDVLAGGELRGSGSLGTLSLASGATVAPGNSIGTLNVVDVTFNAGSVYAVEINAAGESDRIFASGQAILNGGVVEVIPFPDYALNTPYLILGAGSVVGEFAGVDFAGGSLFLTAALDYSPTDVLLTITTADFDQYANTPNQAASAAGAQSTGPGSAVYDAVFALTDATDAAAAFDALSGEIHASTPGVLVEDSRFAREAALARMRASAREQSDAPAVWARAFTSSGETESDGNAAQVDRSTDGLFGGVDAAASEAWRVGAIGGFYNTDADVGERRSSAAIDTWVLGGFVAGHAGQWRTRMGIAYAEHSIDVDRTIAFQGFSETAQADYDATTLQAFAEAGYEFSIDEMRLTPFVGLTRVSVDVDGFSESGPAGLSGDGQTAEATYALLGAEAEATLRLAQTNATLHGRLAWRSAIDAPEHEANLAFAGGDRFRIEGVAAFDDALELDMGVAVALGSGAQLSVGYNGQVADHGADHSVSATFSARF